MISNVIKNIYNNFELPKLPSYLFDWNERILDILIAQKVGVTTYYRINLKSRYFSLIPSIERAHFVSDPELIKKVFHAGRNGEQFGIGFSEFVEPFTGRKNILLCSNDEHRRLRSPLEIPLTKRSLDSNHEIASLSFTMLKMLRVGDFFPDLFAFHTVSEVVLGYCGSELNYSLVIGFMLNPEQNRKDLDDTLQNAYDNKHYVQGKEMDKLQQAYEIGKITEEEKYSSTVALFIAGMETTTQFLSLFISTLQSQPEYRKHIRQEWQDFVNEFNIDFSTEDAFFEAITLFVQGGLKEDKKYEGSRWLKWCYLEMLRLYPIFPVAKRVANQSGYLDGLTFSQGDAINLNLLAYHHDPKIWGENPKQYYPERFQQEGLSSKLYAFGLGSQSCIGRHLVQRESLIFIAELLAMYEWATTLNDPLYSFDGLNIVAATKRFRRSEFTLNLEFAKFMKKDLFY